MITGWLLVLGFVIIQLAMYGLFALWRRRVWTSVELRIHKQLGLSLEDVRKKRGAAMLQFSEDRKKRTWVLVAIGACIFLLIDLSLALSKSVFDRPDALDVFIVLFFFGDVGSGVAWLGFLNAYGNIRIITPEGILKRSPYFLGTDFVRWGQIKWVRWSPFLTGAFVIRTEEGVFQVLPFMENIDVFCRAVMANVPSERWEKARKRLRDGLSGPFQWM